MLQCLHIYLKNRCVGNMDKEISAKLLSLVTGMLVAFSMIYTAEKIGQVYTMGEASLFEKKEYVVVVDAGHGGFDPGKVGVNGEEEKTINLAIAKKVEEYLLLQDVTVVMTRTDENGLYDADANNKKSQDMKRRVEIMETAGADMVVSIHQNSYPEEYVHGGQVFYHQDSPEGERAAGFIQAQLRTIADPDNSRQIKSDNSYYLLKKTKTPIVIVECGFLSNYEEAERLCTQTYQKKVAWGICMGIMQYLNEKEQGK